MSKISITYERCRALYAELDKVNHKEKKKSSI